jgi:hypothetical protein
MFVVLVLVLLRGALHCKLASLSGLITAYALITAIFFFIFSLVWTTYSTQTLAHSRSK